MPKQSYFSSSLKQNSKTDLISKEKILKYILFTFYIIQLHFTNVVKRYVYLKFLCKIISQK